MGQLPDQSLLGVKGEQHPALFPHVFHIGPHRIVVQGRNRQDGRFHLLQDLFHPGGLTASHHHLQLGVALHDRKTDQGGSHEHMIIQPRGQDRRDRMPDRLLGAEGKIRPVATAGKRAAAGLSEQGDLRQPTVDLLDKRGVGGPLRVP